MSFRFVEGAFDDMGSEVPAIVPMFRSRTQGEMLVALLLSDVELSLTDLAERLGAALSTVHREADRLESAGVLTSTRVRNVRFVRANRASPAYAPLRELVERYFGVPVVVDEGFRHVEGIDELYIFGSWVERVQGIEGPEPNDIDVLVIATPDREDAYESALRVERRELQRVPVDDEAARRMLESARTHLTSAAMIQDSDPEMALAVAHDAARKALAALLATQGLRATSQGAHIALRDAVLAHLDGLPGA